MNYWICGVLIPSPTTSGTGTASYITADIAIAQGCLAGIYPANTQTQPPDAVVVRGDNKLLLPGWVNAHTHSSEMWTRGLIPPLPLELWLAELYSYPITDIQQVYWSCLLTALETLESGGTSLVDHLVLIPGRELETVAAADRAYRDIGIRAYLAPLIQDEPFEYSIPGGSQLEIRTAAPATERVLELLEQVVRRFHRPDDGIEVAIAPTGIQLCSDELLKGCVSLSNAHQVCRHAHLLETRAQAQLARDKYGTTAVEHLAQLDFLGPKTSFAHCVWLSDGDIDLMAATGTTVVHNPLSNLRLGSGIAPVLKYCRAGVNVSFGCDGAASNDGQNLFEVLKIGSMLHNTTDLDYRQWLSPQQVSHMASAGGATGVGSERFGCLQVGLDADVVLYDLGDSTLLPPTDPIGQLVWGRPGRVVDSVWVRGRRLLEAGNVLTVDVADLKQQLGTYRHWLGQKQPGLRDLLEPHYRQVMGLPSE